jgi:hypothetical protein
VYKSGVGDKTGVEFKKEDYTHSPLAPITSKYYRSWEQYKELNPLTPDSAKKEVIEQEDAILKFIYWLIQ